MPEIQGVAADLTEASGKLLNLALGLRGMGGAR